MRSPRGTVSNGWEPVVPDSAPFPGRSAIGHGASGSPAAENRMGRSPVEGMRYRNGRPGRAPHTSGSLIFGRGAGLGVRIGCAADRAAALVNASAASRVSVRVLALTVSRGPGGCDLTLRRVAASGRGADAQGGASSKMAAWLKRTAPSRSRLRSESRCANQSRDREGAIALYRIGMST